MVAMSGAIMPAPLAMPLIVTGTPPSLTVAVATFGKVSVVMIARPRSSIAGRGLTRERLEHAVEFAGIERLADHAGRGEIDLVGGCSRRPSPRAAAVSAIACLPFLPVKALALPELTTSARAVPSFSASRHQSTGADGHFERVKTPATAVPSSSSASSTSVRPL